MFSRSITQCVRCGSEFKSTNNKDTCLNCRMLEEEEELEVASKLKLESKNILVATTPILDGYEIEEYLGVESGVGPSGGIFYEDFEESKNIAFEELKFKAAALGGNAVIGIDIDYIEIKSSLNTIVSGTVVKVRKINRVDTLSV